MIDYGQNYPDPADQEEPPEGVGVPMADPVTRTRWDALDDGLRGHKRMAKRFADIYTGKFIHTPGRGWLEFDGNVWTECGEAGPWQAVNRVCLSAIDDMKLFSGDDETQKKQRDALYADIRACDHAGATDGVLKHARHWPGIATRDEQLDAHPGLFVVANGTVDLYAGKFRRSDPADLMTMAGGCEYDENADCPYWDELFAEYQPDQEQRQYIYRMLGASMEGKQNLQHLFSWYGPTAGNGKGTTERAMEHVFGGYAARLPVEVLLTRRGADQYRDEKARLKGKRLVFTSEPSAGQKFDSGTVNNLTGGDKITARAVYKASVTFHPTWLIVMSSNHRLIVPSNQGTVRRLKEVPWEYAIPRDQMRNGPEIEARIRSESSGILNRLIAGWHDFRASGIAHPESVERSTREYLDSIDPIKLFITDCVIEMPSVNTPSSSMFEAYKRWCVDNNETPLPSRLFSPELEKAGLMKKQTKSANVWVGVGLIEH